MPDGIFGPKSETALLCSALKLDLSLDFKKELKINCPDNIVLDLFYKLSYEIYNPIYLAYILATVYHETAGTFLPIEEYNRGKNRKYGQVFDKGDIQIGYCNGVNDNFYKIQEYPHLYYGRGYVQLTWFDNYKKFGELLNENLLAYPKKACEPDIAYKILVLGMTKGLFTGYSLKKAFKNNGLLDQDWLDARKIINGTDKANKIAAEAKIFLKYMILK